MEFLAEYGLFIAKVVTVVVAVLILVAGIVAINSRHKKSVAGHIEVKNLSKHYTEVKDTLRNAVLDKETLKALHKEEKKQEKQAQKKTDDETESRRSRLYVVDFHGDIKASQVDSLREEITAILSIAESQDEVLVRLESAGGVVHGYGLAAAQLNRVRDKGIPLTIAVDKVAASGGYMMACVANKIIAAPFAILGSIGVVAQLPNLHRLLKKYDIDFELHTAGEYKRTLTVFGENTDQGRKKFIDDLEDTHELFKVFVQEHRPILDMEKIATGEIWFGRRAQAVSLVDELKTSDEYLTAKVDDVDIYHVVYEHKKSLPEKLGIAVQTAADRLLLRWLQTLQWGRFFS
ncbi:protease SohB [Zooshikella harenae]|uniref:Protease SohB n=1 Tax=Zooshikella harenae TaxID=2827238 RepID=A0ABS5ZCX8_9GAMM|nr:protease SohB [Zooshikella harenae]MBU2711618.1 protease SohB [Zooshikella harenae]